jgi:RNA polymerase sigma-70 factor (sigma-E family)
MATMGPAVATPAAPSGAGEPDPPPALPADVTAELLDQRARYAEVYEAHRRRLTGLALLLCGDRDRADDAVASAFAKAWPHWRKGRVTDDAGYLTRAVVNEVRSIGRRLVRADAVLDRLTIGRSPERAPATADIGPGVTDRLAVVDALQQLPLRQRAVIVLRYYEDLTEPATAAVLGMRVGTVKSQSFRGLERLRQLLAEGDA